MDIVINRVTRHFILGEIREENVVIENEEVLFIIFDTNENVYNIKRKDVSIQNRNGVVKFKYRHRLVSPLGFGVFREAGERKKLINCPYNFFDEIKKIVLPLINKSSNIVEMGALTQPLFRKEEHNVIYVDYVSTKDIKKDNSRLLNMPNEIFCDVDILTDQFMASNEKFDLIYSAHVLEHTPSIFFTLKNLVGKLVDGGYVVSTIPDKRRTFDRNRRSTDIHDAIGYFILGVDKPAPMQVVNSCMHKYKDNLTLFEQLNDEEYIFSLFEAYKIGKTAVDKYVNCHTCVYTDDEFLLHLLFFIRFNLINAEITLFNPTSSYGEDFTVVLKRNLSMNKYENSLTVVKNGLMSSVKS